MGINRYPGNVITSDANTPTVTSASGVWTIEEQYQYQANGQWPYVPRQIERSLRFNSADSAYLSRTPASAGNQKTWTWSGWVKKGKNGSDGTLFGSGTGASTYDICFFNSGFITNNDKLNIYFGNGSYVLITTALYRDPSAWYHIVVSIDSTQATASDRMRLYVNGTRVTTFDTATYPAQNATVTSYWNTTTNQTIGAFTGYSGYYFDGYITEVNFIDGQALDPTSFGFTDGNGIWQPRDYTGSYGTNGFYLNFSDNSGTTSTTLGKDYSGNSNNWTPNNFSVTAGAGNDSLVDTPTNYGTDTGAGGEVRGNYCTMSPLLAGGTTNVNGNLDVTCPDNKSTGGTFGMSSGKWYFEATVASANYVSVGIARNDEIWGTNLNGSSEAFMYSYVGTVYTKGSADTTPDSFTTNDIISVCVDLDNNKLYFLKNGTGITIAAGTQNPSTGANGISLDAGYTYFSAITANGNSAVAYFNFGQRPFAYTAPTGFKALCTQNLPDPTIADGSTAMNVVTYTGNATNRSIDVGMAPDFTWIKHRSSAENHNLYDILRGAGYRLESNSTDSQTYYADRLTAFTSTGFDLGTGYNNTNGTTYVAWNWKANGAGVSNTAGTITSTVSANTTAGFSIVTYTGNGTTGATVGHGLGVVPEFIIWKRRNSTSNWISYNKTSGAGNALYLDLTNANTASSYLNSTTPTSTVITMATNTDNNGSGGTYVAYCFAPIAGYSAFGSYTGNGSADGPFVYTGFRPRYLLVKGYSTTANWCVWDTARNTYNTAGDILYPNLSIAEVTSALDVDLLSNGFKFREVGGAGNDSGVTYIYAAFAENPFKLSRAR